MAFLALLRASCNNLAGTRRFANYQQGISHNCQQALQRNPLAWVWVHLPPKCPVFWGLVPRSKSVIKKFDTEGVGICIENPLSLFRALYTAGWLGYLWIWHVGFWLLLSKMSFWTLFSCFFFGPYIWKVYIFHGFHYFSNIHNNMSFSKALVGLNFPARN